MRNRRRLAGIALVATVFPFFSADSATADNKEERKCKGSNCYGNGGGDCAGAEEPCEDNDFSPTFDKSPVDITICLPESTCNVGEDEETVP